ncbi:THO complex subunit 6 isoform 1 [Schistosoma japonicum]|uniref:THO complex subunit 6 isoform 1 n=2 Tax=Schistosoma japonicum TaxID=6182 RepID=A0A4Z2D8A7_SCHJA|nr:THO complex subunit 6 isoform 1 [Schistosoma japonicum]
MAQSLRKVGTVQQMNNNRVIAHTLILSSVASPCKKYLIFGTSTQKLLIYSLCSLSCDAQLEGKPESIINVKYAKAIYSLCFGKDYVFCGSVGVIVMYKWTTPTDGFLKYCDTVHLTSANIYTTVSEVTGLCFNTKSDTLMAALGDGTIHTFSISCSVKENLTLAAHKSTIYKICNVGVNEFGTSSEDGTVCFWDQRVLQNVNFKASSIFKPYLNNKLSRPKLGSWLTTLSFKEFEEDWFVTGGGPRLSLWSRRAGRNVSTLLPEGLSDNWYSQTAIFCDIDNDSRIVSGGNSSSLYMWDHVGNLLASVDLHDPPNSRLSHVLVVDTFNLSESIDSLKLKYHSNCALFVGGCGPVIRLIANLGYPLGMLHYSP